LVILESSSRKLGRTYMADAEMSMKYQDTRY